MQVRRFLWLIKLKKAYNNLVKNLDNDSRNIVDSILHNIELVSKDYKALKHIYSAEEKKQLENIFKDYRKNKKKISKNKYVYKSRTISFILHVK